MAARKRAKDSSWSEIDGKSAFCIPTTLLMHPNFSRLSPHAIKLILDLGRQFNPKVGTCRVGANLRVVAKSQHWPTSRRHLLSTHISAKFDSLRCGLQRGC